MLSKTYHIIALEAELAKIKAVFLKEMKLANASLAEPFEIQMRRFFKEKVSEALKVIENDRGIEFVVTCLDVGLKSRWGAKSSSFDKKLIADAKKVMVENVKEALQKNQNLPDEKKLLTSLKEDIESMSEIEFDVLIFAFDKQNPEKKHTIEIHADRPIVLKTPFCISAEVTLRGPIPMLEYKLVQVPKQLFFLKNCFELVKSRFEDGYKIKKLIDTDKLNIYPFIVIDGIKGRQNSDFNDLKNHQSCQVYECFNFYKMIKGVKSSAKNDTVDEYLLARIENGALIDLLHFNNEYAASALYDAIQILVKEVETLKASLNLVTKDTANTSKKLKEKIDTIQTTIEDLKTDMTKMKTDMTKIKTDMTTMKTKMTTMETAINTITSDIQTMKTAISGLTNDMKKVVLLVIISLFCAVVSMFMSGIAFIILLNK